MNKFPTDNVSMLTDAGYGRETKQLAEEFESAVR